MKILIIEDESLIRQALSFVASKRGHEVKTASTGEGGLEMWKCWQPDLVFLDLILSDQNGWTLIKQVSKFSSSKIVLMSAHIQCFKVVKEKGVDIFLPKPFKNIYKTFDKVIYHIQPHSPNYSLSP